MLRIILGDITEVKDVDVIVNSANKRLLGGGGVDGAIHGKAGKGMLEECRSLNGCNVGEAKITKGYDLYVPYVIHAVGPIYYSPEWAKANNYNQVELLRNAYFNALKLAKDYGLKRIVFSAISTGAYGYPIDEATEISLDVIIEFLNDNPNLEISFALYTEEIFDEYVEQIRKRGVEHVVEKQEINFDEMLNPSQERLKELNYMLCGGSLAETCNAQSIKNTSNDNKPVKESFIKKLLRKTKNN